MLAVLSPGLASARALGLAASRELRADGRPRTTSQKQELNKLQTCSFQEPSTYSRITDRDTHRAQGHVLTHTS